MLLGVEATTTSHATVEPAVDASQPTGAHSQERRLVWTAQRQADIATRTDVAQLVDSKRVRMVGAIDRCPDGGFVVASHVEALRLWYAMQRTRSCQRSGQVLRVVVGRPSSEVCETRRYALRRALCKDLWGKTRTATELVLLNGNPDVPSEIRLLVEQRRM